jgi:hypothetical protein
MLGLQWSIPVFPLNQSRQYLECANLIPFPLLELAEMLPVHHIRSSQTLYMAFVDRINYTALYSVEKMLDCHTEPCLALQSQVIQALRELRSRHHPVEVPADGISDPSEMANTILNHAVRLGAADVRVSGYGGYIWARILAAPGYTDILFHAHSIQPEILLPVESRE